MGKSSFIIIFILGIFVGFYFSPKIEPIFSPNAEHIFLEHLNNAKSSVYIESYVFCSDVVKNMIIKKHNEGLDIKILIEPKIMSSCNYETYYDLKAHNISVRFYKGHLMHSKFIVIDNKTLIVGSHNLSENALNKNREASVIIYNSNIIKDFLDVFFYDWKSSY